jgi:predicted nucleotide-binding protein
VETNIKIPSDLGGLTTMRYKNSEELAGICKQIASHITEYGTI